MVVALLSNAMPVSPSCDRCHLLLFLLLLLLLLPVIGVVIPLQTATSILSPPQKGPTMNPAQCCSLQQLPLLLTREDMLLLIPAASAATTTHRTPSTTFMLRLGQELQSGPPRLEDQVLR
jgi:hypothetical protein